MSERSTEFDYALTADEIALLRTCRALDFVPTDRLDEVVNAGLAPVVGRIIAERLDRMLSESGWVEAMRQQQRVERAMLLATQWQRDDQEHLNTFGQHLMGGSVLSCAEQLLSVLDRSLPAADPAEASDMDVATWLRKRLGEALQDRLWSEHPRPSSEMLPSPAWCMCGVVDDRGDGTCGNCRLRIMTDDDELSSPPGATTGGDQ